MGVRKYKGVLKNINNHKNNVVQLFYMGSLGELIKLGNIKLNKMQSILKIICTN
jgi:hypothetical protein